MNDDAGQVWTDAALLTKAQEAHRELQIKLWNVGSPAVREQSAPIDVAANATSLTLPADLLQPIKLQEYAATVETFADATDMTEVTYFNNVAKTTKLIWWSWRKEAVQFLGSTVDRKVIIYYRKLITVPTAAGDPIGILFGELYIGARTAAIAHGSVGNKAAMDTLNSIAESNFGLVLQAQRGQQTPPSGP
jgi:hypothetical protein